MQPNGHLSFEEINEPLLLAQVQFERTSKETSADRLPGILLCLEIVDSTVLAHLPAIS